MATEAMRGCGYRKVGALYLCGEGLSMACDRLPYELTECPVCGAGVKFTRGFTWIDWFEYAGPHLRGGWLCKCPLACPVCSPPELVVDVDKAKYGLLWVGEAFYSPESFIQEALQMGVSKRIAAIPKNLKLGVTWILFAHKKAVITQKLVASDIGAPDLVTETTERPGVFYAFRPQRLELLIWKSEATDEKLAELEKKGITPIIIPDGDIDHDPATKLKITDEEHAEIEHSRFFSGLRSNLGR